MKLVALCGLHGAGKDTVADALPVRKLAFADVLYLEVAEAFGVTVEELRCRETKEKPAPHLCLQNDATERLADYVWGKLHRAALHAPRSPRQILQWWGDYRRAQDPDYFVEEMDAQIQRSMEWDGKPIIITDCRFPNEAAMVRQLGGQIWQVVRPGHNPPRNGHASENDGSEFEPDVIFLNNGTVAELQESALEEFFE